MNSLNIQINTSKLELDPVVNEYGEETRLAGVVSIGATWFHVEAVEVESHNSCEAVDPALQGRINAVADFDEMENPYSTVEILGKHYFVLIFPFQS